MTSQRPYSIRTRIKTRPVITPEDINRVRDHIPLEQGLRLIVRLGDVKALSVRDHIPLEQGLRLQAEFAYSYR